jgi:hypothetical protein
MPYDIIGDIHGHAHELRALLERMGYRETGGAYRHSGRTAIFVGDFIDRGRAQLEAISIARRMLDANSALAVMGNHELNAIAWYTPDPENPDDYMRSHSSPVWGAKNRDQHERFLAELEDKPALHRELVDWFLTLPLWFDLPEIRVVHACWHPEHMRWLAPRLAPGNRLPRELIVSVARENTPECVAAECLTKGIETKLPTGHSFRDKDGHERRNARVRWWDGSATSYRDALFVPDEIREQLPESPIPAEARVIDDDTRPTFVGHYWERGVPEPYSSRVACVDYSAGKGEALVAYRWDGEMELCAEHFAASRPRAE